ncbi:hypothetical protein [Streptomyces sp. TS71-3]|uniref:hypothetical protein n=1 Tax=Streptomyces sp. TS71-3 TaxID=2733862 RepID=UPI001B066626|nr:hypothetical protein [Streptomyces sp. TS71-3]GHJ36713.1 hypothetical protein Sm713_23220 [Streptomyces sp. TS71-3]
MKHVKITEPVNSDTVQRGDFLLFGMHFYEVVDMRSTVTYGKLLFFRDETLFHLQRDATLNRRISAEG